MPSLNRPFVFAVQLVIPATSVNSGSFLVGVGQFYDLYGVFSDINTAGVNIIGLRDSTGLQYTFAGTPNPIPISQLMTPTKVNDTNIFSFVKPLQLDGQVIFLVDVQNTTAGSVTINFAFYGYMFIGSRPA